MERLTRKLIVPQTGEVMAYLLNSGVTDTRARNKLGAYEDAEEQGLLLRLPCKVGDAAYYLHRVYLKNADKWIDTIDEVEVDSFILNINLFVNVTYYIGSERYGKTLTPYKTLFFTREEAEAALEKMKGEEHE